MVTPEFPTHSNGSPASQTEQARPHHPKGMQCDNRHWGVAMIDLNQSIITDFNGLQQRKPNLANLRV